MAPLCKDVEAGSPPSSISRRHPYEHHSHSPAIASRPFAGRIGGNQEFTVSPSDAGYSSIVAKNPDASPIFTWRTSFAFSAFASTDLWKEASVEGVGTCVQIFISGMFAVGLAQNPSTAGTVAGVVIGSLGNVLLIGLWILAAGPVTGGHFNPLITMGTFAARLAVFPRALLYVGFQCAGSVVAGFLLRASLGGKGPLAVVPGCTMNTALITPGEAYVFETMTSFGLLFVAFGVGLDPRQRGVFGPALSPILVGLTLGLCTFASGVVRAGYTGASLNPARCLGLMSAGGNLKHHYVHWAGVITAAILNGIMYHVVPIYKHAG